MYDRDEQRFKYTLVSWRCEIYAYVYVADKV